MDIKKNEPMKLHTSFGIGGSAEFYAEPKNHDEFITLVKYSRDNNLELTVIGGGTNILVHDDGIRGLVISTKKMRHVEIKQNSLVAFAGVKLSHAAELAANAGLSGLEFATGIPGTVGGAVYMNSGAYGKSMADVVNQVTFYDCSQDSFYKYDRFEMHYSYKTSVAQIMHDAFILCTEFTLTEKDSADIKKEMLDFNKRRLESQPVSKRSAGSFFKRPKNNYASKLMDEAGLKGAAVGGAMVSEKHAGFVINTGNATAKDVMDLMYVIKEKVYKMSGITLEPEVRFIGG